MTSELPSWPVTCREVAPLLGQLAERLRPPFRADLDPVQAAARRLAAGNIAAARDMLETVARDAWAP